ncbi:MAG: rod shape-determining protein MreC [Acidobacteriota bacterium]|nr:rod shape-determining protein MreC [Acidobacteriota bacterium]MDE3044406.1 rod shape-determining protein MreC [Acidobacteriota bacterium]MDE3107505.1 rod shape-determining protein MreC [Acidobacteriota bacterium]MDE3222984.1 rod shape-determining protein MreC [Acidobacteriota bacterium]
MVSERSRRRAWFTSILTLSVVIVLYVSGGVVSGLRSAANLVVAPFSFVIDAVARPIGHTLAGVINYSDVVAQNQKLRYELGRAELRANEAWAFQRQLTQLTTNLNVPFVASLSTVTAQVSAVSPTNFAATVDISKGRDDGVLAGMPVVASGGLVGHVIATTPHGATVELVTDTRSQVGVTFGSGSTSLIITGAGVDHGLSATAVPFSSSIAPGTTISTDGLNGGLYPAGIPVATVKTVTLTPGAATYNLTLEPAADLRNLAYVDVVLWEPAA